MGRKGTAEMRIANRYERVKKINNKKLASLLYKAYKLELNLFYSLSYKPRVGICDNSDIIVSLTSYPLRIKDVWVTVATLLSQSRKPNKVILWLSKEQFPNQFNDLPEKLLEMQNYGLTIEFCDDDLRPHKKYYYALCKYPQNRIVTVDDDIFYPENFLEKLDDLSNDNPKTVCCTWAHEIVLKGGKIAPYKEWRTGVLGDKPSIYLMAVGCGGVLYPQNCFAKEIFNIEDIKELCLNCDDIWLKCMEVLTGTKVVRIGDNPLIYFNMLQTMRNGLNLVNVRENRNDIALNNIINKYPEVLEALQDGNYKLCD